MFNVEQRKAWKVAISEGRVVRFEVRDRLWHTSYPTVEGANKALAQALADGLKANIVPPELA